MSLSAAVIIPTHNRVAMLCEVIESVLAQTVATEIFVMDDASPDETSRVVPARFPQVKYHRSDSSRGPTYQRNKAAGMTSADVLFTIDDDCILRSPQTIEQTLGSFGHPRVAAVTIPFVNVLQNPALLSAAPDDQGIWINYDYYGGMVAIRRDVYRLLGGYREFYFIQVEEPDLATRLLDAGYVVRLGSADPIDHMESPNRDTPRRHRQGPRNHVLYSFYNAPWPVFPAHLAGTMALCAIGGRRDGHLLLSLQGVGQGLRGIWSEWRHRQPVTRHAFGVVRTLKTRQPMRLEELEPMLPPMRPL